MTRPYLVLDHDQRDLTARYLKTLAAVERAFALGDFDDLEHCLGSVDPADLKALIAALESARAEPKATLTERSRTSSIPLVSDETAPTAPRPSAPAAPYPEVVHAFDTWSRKVPCR